jgi:hypothetical protein
LPAHFAQAPVPYARVEGLVAAWLRRSREDVARGAPAVSQQEHPLLGAAAGPFDRPAGLGAQTISVGVTAAARWWWWRWCAGTPWYALHGCETATMMAAVGCDPAAAAAAGGGCYLLSWLSLVGPLAGAKVDLQAAARLLTAQSW